MIIHSWTRRVCGFEWMHSIVLQLCDNCTWNKSKDAIKLCQAMQMIVDLSRYHFNQIAEFEKKGDEEEKNNYTNSKQRNSMKCDRFLFCMYSINNKYSLQIFIIFFLFFKNKSTNTDMWNELFGMSHILVRACIA